MKMHVKMKELDPVEGGISRARPPPRSTNAKYALTFFALGIFTATKAGTYMFSAHVRSGSNRGGLAIKKNNVVICKLWVTESHGSNIPSGNAVTHLVPGDQVKVTGDDVDAATIDVDYKGFSGIQVDTD